MPQPLLIIGIGNQYRSDDAAGLIAGRLLREKNIPDILVRESSSDGAALMESWKSNGRVILIDAVSSGAAPGTIYRIDALAQPLPAGFSSQSTHAFGVAEALGLARALRQLPTSLVVYGIEGKNFSAGVGLTQEVERAVREVVEQVTHDVQAAF